MYIEAWDGEVSTNKPTVRPHDAWITDPTAVTATIKKPGDAPDLELSLQDGEIVAVRDGEWRVRFLADAGAGDYWCDGEVYTADGHIGPAPIKVRVHPRPT